MTVSVDYWKIDLKDQISAFPEQAIFENPAKYAANYIRCNTLSATQQALYDRCQGGYVNSRAIAYVIGLTDNLGGVRTSGVDFTAAYAFTTSMGRTALSYSGTIVNNYEYQRTPTDPYVQNVAKYVDSSPILRGQHVFGVDHKMGKLGVNLSVRHKTGYEDQNAGGEGNTVGAYTLTDLGLNYQVMKGLTVAGGVKNLFDVEPPFSNQGTVFQKGYDPRLTDPVGRALWLRMGYSFK